MVFSEILLILSEAYLEILVVSMLNIQSHENDQDNNTFNDIMCYILLSLAAIMLTTTIFIIA